MECRDLLLSKTGNDFLRMKVEERRGKVLKNPDINMFQGEGTLSSASLVDSIMNIVGQNLSFVEVVRFLRLSGRKSSCRPEESWR